MKQTNQVDIVVSSLDWFKSKESINVKENGIIVDEIVDCLMIAKENNFDLLHLLRDVFIVTAMETDGSTKQEMFELFVMVKSILALRESK